LGLGIEQFMAGKKIDMLNAAATYLQARNEKLANLNTKIKNDFNEALVEIKKTCTGL